MMSNDKKVGARINRKERERAARAVSWVPTAKVGWTLPSPARHGGCKKNAPAAPLALSLDGDRDLNRRIEKRDAGSEWLQKDQKQNREQ